MNITQTKQFDLGIKSVPSPPAQIYNLCDKDNAPGSMIYAIESYILKNSNDNNIVTAVLSLMHYHGLRITEVLNIRPYDVLRSNRIRIKGLKHSNDRIVYIMSHGRFWASYGVSTSFLSDTYSRYYFYREFKKLGFYSRFGSNKKYSVTHLMRHNYVLSLKESDIETNLIQTTIGHKSINSTKHYEQKERKESCD